MAHTDHGPSVPIAGQALAMFAFDIGFQVDLDAAEPLVREATRQRLVRARRTAPVWFDYSPPPLRIVMEGDAVAVDGRPSEATTELLIYDFGAAFVTYRLGGFRLHDRHPRPDVAERGNLRQRRSSRIVAILAHYICST